MSAQTAHPAPEPAGRESVRQVLRAVLAYRVYFMGDRTKISTCRLIARSGTSPADIAATLPPALAALIDTASSACGPALPARGSFRNIASIMSITGDDSTATATLLISHGGYIHEEQYQLRLGENTWFVSRVVLNAGWIID